MDYGKLKRILQKNTKGAFTSIVYERQLPVRKAFADNIVTKRSAKVVRLGVEYDNMKAVQAKRASGEIPAVNAGLTWGEWDVYPFTITHKGSKYLRVAPSTNNKTLTQYFLNGKPVTKEDVIPLCTKSAFSSGASPDVLSIKLDNIISIG